MTHRAGPLPCAIGTAAGATGWAGATACASAEVGPASRTAEAVRPRAAPEMDEVRRRRRVMERSLPLGGSVFVEDGFDRLPEDMRDLESEREGRVIAARLKRVHGLARHAEMVRQIRLAPALLAAQ